MRLICALSIFSTAVLALPLSAQETKIPPERDIQSIEILRRAVQAAEGGQAIAAVHDITEKGEVAFHSVGGSKGPVTIQLSGANHFRLEADLAGGKITWAVHDAVGSERKGSEAIPISYPRITSLANLTFPIEYAADAIADQETRIAYSGVESREGRSIYRIRITGSLGLTSRHGAFAQPVSKDLLIDALTFDILSVEDGPFLAYQNFGSHHCISHAVDFDDFRSVRGVRVPFSIVTKAAGQKMLSIHLAEAVFNSNLQDRDFE
jgi:hypothetical protein